MSLDHISKREAVHTITLENFDVLFLNYFKFDGGEMDINKAPDGTLASIFIEFEDNDDGTKKDIVSLITLSKIQYIELYNAVTIDSTAKEVKARLIIMGLLEG